VDLGDDVKPTQDSRIDQVIINGRYGTWKAIQDHLSLLAACVEAEDDEGAAPDCAGQTSWGGPFVCGAGVAAATIEAF